MRNFLFIVTILVSFTTSLHGQDLTGRVTDDQSVGLAAVNVVVLRTDSSFVEGTTTDGQGTFTLTKAKGDHLLRISLLGYQTRYIPIKNIGRPLVITLKPDTKTLGEVVINAQGPQTKGTPDGMKTLVAGTLLEKTNDINDMLSLIPQLSATGGTVTVFGRGTPEIYINNKKMRNANELSQLRPSDIKSVEVINNPGARYTKNITAVVRIVTKRPTGEGFRFDDRQTAMWQEHGYGNTSNDLYLGWRQGRLDLTANLYGRYGSKGNKQEGINEVKLDKTYTSLIRFNNDYNSDALYGELNGSYQLGSESSVGASINCWYMPGRRKDIAFDNCFLVDGQLTEHTTNQNQYRFTSPTVSGNAYYVGKIRKLGIELNADYYSEIRHNLVSGQQSELLNPAADTKDFLDQQQDDKSTLWALRLNMTYPLLRGELGIGGEASTVHRTGNSSLRAGEVKDGNDMRLIEDLGAGYIEYSHKVGHLALKGGLRYELVTFDYYDHNIHQDEQSKTYARFFPSFSAAMPWGKTEWQLTYSRSVNRPPFYSLSSRIDYINSYTYQTGNPLLMPEYTDALGLNLSWKWLSFSAMYKHIDGEIVSSGSDYHGNPKIGVVDWTNLKAYDAYTASLQVSPSFGIYRPVWRLMLFHQFLDLPNAYGLRFNHPIMTLNFTHRFQLPFGIFTLTNMLQSTGNQQNTYKSRPYFVNNVQFQTWLFKKRLSISASVNDVLHTGISKEDVYSGNRRIGIKNYPSTSAQLTLRYTFNDVKSKYLGGGQSSQRSRM